MNTRICLGCLALLAALSASPARSAELRAGAGKVDITPPPGLAMYGYFDRIEKHELSTGTLDPLYARVVVLEVGEKRLALVTLDLGRTFNEAWLGRMREAALKDSHIGALLVSASHTHSGPNIVDIYPPGGPPEWENAAFDKILQAIHDAAAHLEPARLGTDHGLAYVSYNRRRVNPDGTVTMMWTNAEKVANGPVDPTVGVLRVDRADGTPMAILVNYACHPVVYGSDNLRYSADFVGPMTATVESAFDGKPLCLFLQGAAGDIKPYFGPTSMAKGGVEKCEWTGRELGTEAARVAKGIKTTASADPSLDYADDVMDFKWRWEPGKFHDDLLRAKGPLIFQDHADALEGDSRPALLSLHVGTVLINRQIALVSMPGEPFVEFQVGWRNRCPVRSAFFLGYTNGYYDYFPTLLAATQGGYGAADSDTYVEVGAGERMLDHAVIRAHEMMGELSDVPVDTPWVLPPSK
jgi:hypothetical protein